MRAKPFLKWVGGKNQILDNIVERFPTSFNRYIEPFVGGGSVFFKVVQRFNLTEYYISDINKDLIFGYQTVKNNVKELIEILNNIKSLYLKSKDKKIFYYKIRDEFNKTPNSIEKTAKIIFLNKTCFNGIFRVNSYGNFNVPFNNLKKLYFDFNNIQRISNILNNNKVHINSFDFTMCKEFADENTFIYMDPPYYNTFTSYTVNDFTEDDQIRLLEFYRLLDKRKVKLMLSNSSNRFLENLYSGYNIEKIPAKRFINADSNGRGEVDELIITNYERKKQHHTQIKVSCIL